MKKFFKTHEIAKICQVAQGTVIRWIKEGKLAASSTAGGHNRVQAKDLFELLKSLRLPIPAELSPESAPLVDENIRILIVDDEVEMRRMIRWKIEQDFRNAEVEEAGEGFVAGWKTHNFRPHLVILDLMLPGMDGFHVCEFIRQFPDLKDIKIIAISALMGTEVSQKILGLGANDVLEKPLDLDVLKQKISAQLKGHTKENSDAA